MQPPHASKEPPSYSFGCLWSRIWGHLLSGGFHRRRDLCGSGFSLFWVLFLLPPSFFKKDFHPDMRLPELFRGRLSSFWEATIRRQHPGCAVWGPALGIVWKGPFWGLGLLTKDCMPLRVSRLDHTLLDEDLVNDARAKQPHAGPREDLEVSARPCSPGLLSETPRPIHSVTLSTGVGFPRNEHLPVER